MARKGGDGMKLKVSRGLHGRMLRMKQLSRLPGGVTEVAARALRGYWNAAARGERVELRRFRECATRKDSTVLTLDLPPALVGGLSCADLRAVLAWRIEEAERKAGALPEPFVAPAVKVDIVAWDGDDVCVKDEGK